MIVALWLFIAAPRQSALMLGGERVSFDSDFTPRFSAAQIKSTAGATRAGLEKWAKTPQGKRLITYFTAKEYTIHVVEDASEAAAGRAPQPGIAMMVAAADHSKMKSYTLILNPTRFSLPPGMEPILNEPASASDMMAIAWAGEMLHIFFYSQGVVLPHHPRPEFQNQWWAVANELGMALVKHDD